MTRSHFPGIFSTRSLISTYSVVHTLNRYRGGHRISVVEHRERLREHGWTEEEFEAGFQELAAPKDMSKENFLKYEALLKSELDTGEVR